MTQEEKTSIEGLLQKGLSNWSEEDRAKFTKTMALCHPTAQFTRALASEAEVAAAEEAEIQEMLGVEELRPEEVMDLVLHMAERADIGSSSSIGQRRSA